MELLRGPEKEMQVALTELALQIFRLHLSNAITWSRCGCSGAGSSSKAAAFQSSTCIVLFRPSASSN